MSAFRLTKIDRQNHMNSIFKHAFALEVLLYDVFECQRISRAIKREAFQRHEFDLT